MPPEAQVAANAAAAGPIEVSGDDDHEVHSADEGLVVRGGDADATALPAGLAVAQDGFRLQVDDTSLRAGAPSDFGFRVVDGGGAAVTRFGVEHEKRLHLVIVGRNLVDYAHLHPSPRRPRRHRRGRPTRPRGFPPGRPWGRRWAR